MHKVVIIGSGQVGQTLGRLLNQSNKYKVIGVWDRNLNHARAGARFIGRGARIWTDKTAAVQQADIVFITTPDSVIQQVCDGIFAGNHAFSNKVVLHCSGSLPSAILNSAQRHQRVYIASIHPIQTFADKPETVRNFKGTYCVYEGQRQALAIVRNIISALGGKAVEIKAKDKTLYHIGCVFASNYLVTLMRTAQEFLRGCGFKDKDILRAIQPLVNATVRNIMTIGPASALTGPIARGDALIIKDHIRTIRKIQPLYMALYREFGKHTVVMARQKGTINVAQASLLQKAMSV